ncbi:CARDB domain-containing protein [Thermococcus sp. JdF3]|uniref:CARDB domain-containing protein n=1 Tax=Thermococcus sp. JdF3 TaxID=1638258 RepID=UPI0014390273|nr:CARDB domain-containing protein [Thermococcus sp. JdF3]NJE01882.1 hypothetical protein [Thermococcus sp. JdF3]
MALLEAKKGGNDNPEIDKIINQKMAELKQSLGVYMIYSTSKIKRVSCYDNIKPGQPRPMNGADTEETVPVENTSNDVQEPLNLPEWLIKEALDMENTLGVLEIKGISVVVDRNDAGEIKYHVEISMVAKYNSVSKIRVNVSDKTSGGTDTGTISYLGPDEEETWRSGKFSARVSGSSIRITGNVKITYRPVCSSPPTSFKDGQTLSRKCQDRTITRSYSETIDLGSSIDWSKVDVIVTASRHNIVEGESVTYTVKVKNGNSLPVDGVKYRVTVSLPQFDPKNYSGTVTIPANGEKTILTKTVAYPDSGTYLARATISWNGHKKSASDKVIVTTGTLVISDVDVSPRNPDDGDRVRFDVSIRNPSSRSRSLNVKLFIDGVKESSRTVSIGGNDESTTTLTWTATAGNHDWRVEVWEDGKLEDSRSGEITIQDPPTSTCLSDVPLEGHLEVYPEWVEAGDSVSVHITVTNLDPNCAQGPFNIKLVDDSGAKWWPKKDTEYGCSGCGYIIQGGALKIYAGKTMSEWSEPKIVTQNTILYLKIGGKTVATANVYVNDSSLIQAKVGCENPVFDFKDHAYRAVLSCWVDLKNPYSTPVDIRDIAVSEYSITGALNDTLSGAWTVNPLEFTLAPQDVKRVTFKLPLEISSWVPVSVADATEVVIKNNDPSTADITYTLGYKLESQDTWSHFTGNIRYEVKVKMDSKTVAADYILSGTAAIVDPNTAISFQLGSIRISGIRLSSKLSFDPLAFLWNAFIKPGILEHT